MELLEINKKIENIEQEILYNSVNNFSIEKLGWIYNTLIELKEAFILANFQGSSKEDIDGTKFKLAESILNIRIYIKEKLGLNCDIEVLQMKKLWN